MRWPLWRQVLAPGENVCSGRRSRVVLAPRPWRYAGGKSRRQRGQERPLPRGEHEGNRSNHCAGKAGVLAVPVVTNSCPFLFWTRGCVCRWRPAFPAPSAVQRVNEMANLGWIEPRERERMSKARKQRLNANRQHFPAWRNRFPAPLRGEPSHSIVLPEPITRQAATAKGARRWPGQRHCSATSRQ
jgi:hypothetical protein